MKWRMLYAMWRLDLPACVATVSTSRGGSGRDWVEWSVRPHRKSKYAYASGMAPSAREGKRIAEYVAHCGILLGEPGGGS